MTKKQHYMTYGERLKLEAYYNDARWSVSRIARTMGFCRQTIYNELKLGAYQHTIDYRDVTRYSADKAQQLHTYAQSGKGRPEKIGNDHETAQFLEQKILHDRFSPAAALAEARKAGCKTIVSVGTLYNYIYKGMFLEASARDLWEKPRRKARAKNQDPQRITHPKLPSIEDRPEIIWGRSEPGHWEMDLVVGCKGCRSVLLTMTERQTREEIIRHLPNRQALTIRQALDQIEEQTPDFRTRFKSITTDNGSEFLRCDELKESIHGGQRFEVYYCHLFSAWEKGTNENHNRMIRRFFPKGTNFDEIDDARIAAIQDWMNNYPRKVLDWKTPNEMRNTVFAAAESRPA